MNLSLIWQPMQESLNSLSLIKVKTFLDGGSLSKLLVFLHQSLGLISFAFMDMVTLLNSF